MREFLIIFLFMFFYRLAINIAYLIRTNHYAAKYSIYIVKQDTYFAKHTYAILQLFKAADVTDYQIPFTSPSDFGYLTQGNTSLFHNIENLREEVVSAMIHCFAQAAGTFRHRIIENFSPIFWINCLIFLPRKIFEYLGLKGDSVSIKALQLLYWLTAPFLLFFRDNIYQYIFSLFG